jgi:hypothetical protein
MGHEEDPWYEEDEDLGTWVTYYDTCGKCRGKGRYTEAEVIILKLKGRQP